MNIIFLNNQFLPANKANIAINDRGFLLGDGLFETMRIYNGNPLFLTEHWERLQQSAKILDISLHLSKTEIKKIILELLEHNRLSGLDAVVRITLTRGSGERGLSFTKKVKPTLMVTTFIFQPINIPCKLVVSKIPRNEFSPLSNIKSLNYLDNILANQYAVKMNADDALMLNTAGNVASTTSANIFMIKNNTIFTPKISDGILPGIMRAHIIKKCADLNFEVFEKTFNLDHLKTANEIFISNSLIGIRVVYQLDDIFMNNRTEIMNALMKITSPLARV